MTERSITNLARARQLDDPHPDNVCPGCGADITGWRQHHGHQVGPAGVPARWHDHRSGPPCPWTDDMLNARVFRRLLLAGTAPGSRIGRKGCNPSAEQRS